MRTQLIYTAMAVALATSPSTSASAQQSVITTHCGSTHITASAIYDQNLVIGVKLKTNSSKQDYYLSEKNSVIEMDYNGEKSKIKFIPAEDKKTPAQIICEQNSQGTVIAQFS